VFFLGRRPLSDPALEVADFIMHAVGRQARHRLQGQEGFVRDFAAVFHTVDAKLASFSRPSKRVRIWYGARPQVVEIASTLSTALSYVTYFLNRAHVLLQGSDDVQHRHLRC
jgi:hypothetical protein